jgi:hypothetical protein
MGEGQRLGVPMAAQLLEEGRYLVLWPLQQPLVVAGCGFVIDAYTGGDSVLVDEVSCWVSPAFPPLQLPLPLQLCMLFVGGFLWCHCASVANFVPP